MHGTTTTVCLHNSLLVVKFFGARFVVITYPALASNTMGGILELF